MKTKKKKIKKVIKKKVVKKVVKRDIGISQETVHKTRVRVIGIGGGGGSIVSEIVSRIKKADFVVANTDVKALRAIRKVKRFQFGQNLTKGLGTGMNIEVGEAAAQEDKEKIQKLFEGQDICIIVSSFGGGAGSGATPVFAKISKNTGCLTYGIFTMPFEFEGERKMEIAKEAIKKIRPHLNAFSIIPNERIFKIIDKNTPLKDALSAINERLAENLGGLIGMIYIPGLINIDFADLKTILSGRGRLAYLNTIEIAESEKEDAIRKVISSPLYPYTIKGAKGILYNIIGDKFLQLSEVSKFSKIISDSVNKNAKIIFGIGQNPKKKGEIKMTLLATGCVTKGVVGGVKKILVKKRKRRKKIIKKEDQPKVEQPKIEKPKIKKPKIQKVKKKITPIVKKPIPQKVIPTSSLPSQTQNFGDVKVRRNALQVKKAIEQEEKELLAKEKIWETPAILRKKDND